MHIAIVCRYFRGHGGPAAVARSQALELTRHARVTVLSNSFPDDIGSIEPRYVGVRRYSRIPLVGIAIEKASFAWNCAGALVDLHREHPVDFVLCHHPLKALAAIRRFRKRSGVPIGVAVHEDIFDRPPGTYDKALTALLRWTAPRVYRSADVVMVSSPEFAEFARRGGASDKRIAFVENGIDPALIGLEALPSPAERGSGPLKILSVGRLAVEKGMDVLIEACSKLTFDFQLNILGSGPAEPALRRLIERLALGDRVQFLGRLPRHELGALYRSHHVFCSAALSEPFGAVILEALVSGLPVIGTEVGGTPVMVRHEHNGLLVPPSDPSAIAAALTRVANESFRRSLAANATASVLPRFEWRTVGDQLMKIIEQTVRRVSGA